MRRYHAALRWRYGSERMQCVTMVSVDSGAWLVARAMERGLRALTGYQATATLWRDAARGGPTRPAQDGPDWWADVDNDLDDDVPF